MSKVRRKKPKPNEQQKPQEKSRKLLRKEKRLQKKNRRVAYFVKKAEWKKSKDTQSNPVKEQTAAAKSVGKIEKNFKQTSKGDTSQETLENIRKEHEDKNRLEKEMAKQRRIQLLQANKEEDRNIRRLEKLLKLDKKKKKKIPKSFYEDNLGCLLEVCDKDYLKKLAETEKAIQDSGSEFEDDFAAATGRKLRKKKKKDPSNSESASDSDDDSEDALKKSSTKNKSGTIGPDKTQIKKTDATQKQTKKIKSNTKSLDDIGSEGEEYSDFHQEESDNSDESDFGLGFDDGSESEDGEDLNEKEEKGKRKRVHFSDEITDKKLTKKPKTQSHDTDPKEVDRTVAGKKNKAVTEKTKKRDALKNSKVNINGKKKVGSKSNCDPSDSEAGDSSDDTDGDTTTDDDGGDTDDDIATDDGGDADGDVATDDIATDDGGDADGDVATDDDGGDTDDDIGTDDDGDADGDIATDDSGGDLSGSEDGSKDGPSGAVKRNPDGTWEDIYGRLRSSTGDVIQQGKTTKYVPPALRAQPSDSKRQELERLRRQMKGLMNRLAESTVPSISSQIDELYMTNSRHDMNDTLTQLTLEALISSVLTPDRLVMEHCLLISVLHANVGSEVGAHFLQAVVQKFDQLLSEDPEVEDKRVDNVVHIIAHLYNFKIFSASLIFSILNKVSESLNEKRVDLLLLILRTVGSTLRKDDPHSLKSLVLQLQTKAAAAPELQENSRVKFMLEVLLAIKNNNMYKIPNYSPETIEHAKKLLRFLTRQGKYVTELNISLDDLLKADERGRWWIVGSAWTGHLPGETGAETTPNPKKAKAETSESHSTELLELARKQRMNTDTRRNIFCILLTAEDYLDAFEKLLHLNLKNQQEQEIIHVLLHCALQEKTFNPYYAHLAQKFCDFDRKYQMKIQYCVWDKLKDLSSLQNFQITNLARFLAHLFLEKGLAISVLKVVSFAEIDKVSMRLIRQILLNVLLVEDRNESEAVFLRVAPSPKLRLFREGLRLFIRHFMLRPSRTKFLSEEERALLEERAVMAEKALSAAESEVQF